MAKSAATEVQDQAVETSTPTTRKRRTTKKTTKASSTTDATENGGTTTKKTRRKVVKKKTTTRKSEADEGVSPTESGPAEETAAAREVPRSTASAEPKADTSPDSPAGRSGSAGRSKPNRQVPPNQPLSPELQAMAAAGKKKKKRKKRKKSGGGSGGGQSHQQMPDTPPILDTELPSDEELEREAAELAAEIGDRYDEVKKDAIHLSELQRMELDELYKVAHEEGLAEIGNLKKQDLIFKILKSRIARQGLMFGEGTLEILPDGFGFLRSPLYSYLPSPDDIYVSPSQVRRFGLRKGCIVQGLVRPPKETERYFALLRVDNINGRRPEDIHDLPVFEDMTPLHPDKRFQLETEPNIIETRVVDLVAPSAWASER
jgi:transcription termination factor Rho